jgi:hypothetical protein
MTTEPNSSCAGTGGKTYMSEGLMNDARTLLEEIENDPTFGATWQEVLLHRPNRA